MNTLTAITSVDYSCQEVLRRVTRSLLGSGLRVLETFDLQDARLGLADCPCPHHGAAECDCQMVVLMVYGQAIMPAALILHGSDGKTWLSLINDAPSEGDALIQAIVEKALREIPASGGL